MSIFCCHLTPLSLVQAMQSPSTLSSVISLLSMVWHSTLMKTWLRSVPLASASLSTRTCTTAKVCSNCQTFQIFFFPCKSFHQSCSITVSQLEIHSINAASAANKSASGDSRTIRTLQDMSAASALDQFAQTTRLALKTKSVKEQLDSVLVIIRPVPALLNYKIHYMNSTVHLLLCH